MGAGFSAAGSVVGHLFGGNSAEDIVSSKAGTPLPESLIDEPDVHDWDISGDGQEDASSTQPDSPAYEPPKSMPIEDVDTEVKRIPLGDQQAVEDLYAETAGGHPAPENIPVVSDVADAATRSEPYKGEQGDRLWNLIAEREGVKGLEEGRQSNAIANTIAEIKKSPEALEALGFDGPDDIDNIELDQEMDLAKIDEILETAKIEGEGIVEHAQGLDEETVASIDENDKKIADWRADEANKDIPLTEQQVEEILHGDADASDVSSPEALSQETADSGLADNIREVVNQKGDVESLIKGYNDNGLFDKVTATSMKNGDIVFNFDVKDDTVNVQLIMTEDKKIAIDGYQKLNWPDGVKLDRWGGIFSRDLNTFADLNEQNWKEAIKFLNEGNFTQKDLLKYKS